MQERDGNGCFAHFLQSGYPFDIRIQRNRARAFVKHEIRFKKNLKEVQRWKDALKEVANISGWHLQNR